MTASWTVRRGLMDLGRELPRAPGDPSSPMAPVVNPLLSWLNLYDSDGTEVDRYQLLIGGGLTTLARHPMMPMWQALVEGAYALGSTLLVYAVAIVDVITNPAKLVSWLGSVYEAVTSKLYAVIPPDLLIVTTFTILLFSVFMLEPRKASKTAPNDFPLYRMRQSNWERLAAGFFIASLALALSKNPFRPLRSVMSTISDLAGYVGGGDTQNVQQARMSAAVNTIVRPLTQLITYHDTLDPSCTEKWAKRLDSGSGTIDCLTSAQKAAASNPGVYTLILSILLLLVAASYAFLAYIVVRYSVSHAAWAAAHIVGLAYIAGIAILQRRPYDPLIRSLSKAAAHGAMLLIILSLSVILPAWSLEAAHAATWLPLWLQFLAVAVGIGASGYLIQSVANEATLAKIASLFQTKVMSRPVFTSWMYPEYVTNESNWLLTSAAGDRLGGVVKDLYGMRREDFNIIWDEIKAGWKDVGTPSTVPENLSESSAAEAATHAKETTVVQADPDTPALAAALSQPSLDPGTPVNASSSEASQSRNSDDESGGTRVPDVDWTDQQRPIPVQAQWVRPEPTPTAPTSAVAAIGSDGNTVSVVPPVDAVVDPEGSRLFIGRDDGIPYFLGSNNGVPYLVQLVEDQFSTLRSLTEEQSRDRSLALQTAPGSSIQNVPEAMNQAGSADTDRDSVHEPALESGRSVASSGAAGPSTTAAVPRRRSTGSWVRPRYQDLTEAPEPEHASSRALDVEELFFIPEHPVETALSSVRHHIARMKYETEHGGTCTAHSPEEAKGAVYATVDLDGSVTISVPGQGGVGDSTWS